MNVVAVTVASLSLASYRENYGFKPQGELVLAKRLKCCLETREGEERNFPSHSGGLKVGGSLELSKIKA